jgi:hypothetical protein
VRITAELTSNKTAMTDSNSSIILLADRDILVTSNNL